MDANHIEEAMTDLKEKSIPIQIDMFILEDQEEKEHRVFGPVLYSPAEEQKRFFDFNSIVYYDEEFDKQIEIVGLELTPLSAVWKVRYNDAKAVHTPGQDIEAYKSWLALEDKLCSEAQLVFKDGQTFSTGCVLSSPYADGVVNLECSWGSTINIDDVQHIVLDNQILWDNESVIKE